MKILFLLDNNEFVEVAPEALQIRQLQPGVAALGTEVTVPVTGEDGKPELNEDGTPKTQKGYRPFINYNVNLSIPQPVETTAPAVALPVKAADPNANGKASAKPAAKKAAKKKA